MPSLPPLALARKVNGGMSGKITRKVTVEKGRRLSADSSNAGEQSSSMKKKSVFERLGTAGPSYEVNRNSAVVLCESKLRPKSNNIDRPISIACRLG